jgi:hypothetical protein
MADVRLKTNMILDGTFHPYGTVLEADLVPPHLRNAAHIEDVESSKSVLVLRTLNFQTAPIGSSSGIPTSYPKSIAVGEVIDLDSLPPAYRQTLVEGTDYCLKWSVEQQRRLQLDEENAFIAELMAEPTVPGLEPEPARSAPWRKR